MYVVSVDEKPGARASLSFANDGGIAQLVERLVRNEKARGSNPLTSSLCFEDEKRRLSRRSETKADLHGDISPVPQRLRLGRPAFFTNDRFAWENARIRRSGNDGKLRRRLHFDPNLKLEPSNAI